MRRFRDLSPEVQYNLFRAALELAARGDDAAYLHAHYLEHLLDPEHQRHTFFCERNCPLRNQ